MILKSNRKFGVEIEFYAPSKTSYDAVVAKLPTERDGSLDGRQYGREYVSPVLMGKTGEQRLIKDCAVLNKHKCQSGDARTSMHIHLDGRKFQNIVEETKGRDTTQTQIAISNKLYKDLGKDNAERIIRGDYLRIDEVKSSKIDNVTYLGYSTRTTHPVLNYKYYNVYAHDDFKFMKNVFYFYTLYSSVMEMMVSNSRKKGNMYCIPLGECFDLAAIEDCRTMNDLENVWYKSTDRFDNYNNSRYHNVNLHCYFTESKGTVEIQIGRAHV